MALVFRRVTFRSSFQPDACLSILKKRTQKSGKYGLDETTNSLIYKDYFISTLSWWDWHNSLSEPKFIGRIASRRSGTLISGYYIPGFGALLTPILIPLAIAFFANWLIRLWLEPIASNVDTTRYYFALSLFSIVLTFAVLGLIWICFHDRWENDALIKKLLSILNGELIERESDANLKI
ncbi:hypothetical protein [Parasphingorhabdus sp.]|uniref:hypothetical protein n=1 Tax=Parasphingorhabdus sp. TaxID=2709688 RepID=UPI003D26D9F2